MCQKLIEKYSCGDSETATFPCEELLTDGTCKKTEEDKIIDHADKECRECQHMADALKQIAEDTKLAPEPRRGGEETRDPNAPKKYFIEYIKWSKCGHHSHPKWTDIERFDDGPELGFEIEGLGRCHGCSEADPQTLARMEKSGALAQTDPWGAMDREPDVAAGSSGAGADDDDDQPSTEAIALNITNSALKDLRTSASRSFGAGGSSAAAVAAGRRAIGDLPSRSPSPEFDTSAGKGKGRRGHDEETYASRYGAGPKDSDDDEVFFESDDDEPDFDAPPPHDRRGRRSPGRGGRPSRRSRSEDTLSDDESPPHNRQDRSPPARGGPPQRRSHNKDLDSDDESPPPGFHSDEDEDHLADADDDNDDKEISISASERQRLAIPLGFKVTRQSLMRFEARRAAEGRLAMTQHRSGEVED